MFVKKFLPGLLVPALFCHSLMAQPSPRKHKKCRTCNDQAAPQAGQFKKNEFYFYWGYNRALFSKSDIRFIGVGSDFTLHHVVAKDRPTPFNFNDYVLAPSIPQFVVSAGWFFKDKWCLTFGTDHMKYVMKQDQVATITGDIATSNENGKFAGHYTGEQRKLSTDFLMYEHTNGLNYVNSGLEYYHTVWDARKGPFKFVVVPGMSVALLYPRSDVTLFGVHGDNLFHVAGWGTAVHAGFRFNILKNIFVMWNNKGGFIALPDVLCEKNRYDAKQHFFFYQSALSLGVNWRF